MKVIYGTTNGAKLASMSRIADFLGFEILGLNELNMPVPWVDEPGKNPLENAIIKAKAYYKAFNMPVFSCDSGLYFENLQDDLQPGTHIRRVKGKELTDEEMIEYYSGLARNFHGKLVGRYKNAISFVYNRDCIFSSMGDSLMTEPFILTQTPHVKREIGFPLDSLSLDCATGEYFFDLKDRAVDKSAVEYGFRSFFVKVLSEIKSA